MKLNLNILLPDWAIVRRFIEWLNPGIIGQSERWGRVVRMRNWCGSGIRVETTAEVIEHEGKCPAKE